MGGGDLWLSWGGEVVIWSKAQDHKCRIKLWMVAIDRGVPCVFFPFFYLKRGWAGYGLQEVGDEDIQRDPLMI